MVVPGVDPRGHCGFIILECCPPVAGPGTSTQYFAPFAKMLDNGVDVRSQKRTDMRAGRWRHLSAALGSDESGHWRERSALLATPNF